VFSPAIKIIHYFNLYWVYFGTTKSWLTFLGYLSFLCYLTCDVSAGMWCFVLFVLWSISVDEEGWWRVAVVVIVGVVWGLIGGGGRGRRCYCEREFWYIVSNIGLLYSVLHSFKCSCFFFCCYLEICNIFILCSNFPFFSFPFYMHGVFNLSICMSTI
jgi:hypothetical protein